MPLNIPNLDDRGFNDLVAQALPLVTRYAPQWTNHNPSDPGITLIELLAYISEILIYRLNRITRETKLKFLQLLIGATSAEAAHLNNKSKQDVDEALRKAVGDLYQLQRAVTTQDYEQLIKRLPRAPDQPQVARSKCFCGMDLEASRVESRQHTKSGHVSVVIVPDKDITGDQLVSMLKEIRDQLEPKRMLTTRLHIVQPIYLWVSLGAEIKIKPDAGLDDVRKAAIEKVRQYFNPLPDVDSRLTGWSFGRPVYLSEIYAKLEEVPGIDYVRDVKVLRLSDKPGVLDRERAGLGIQIGIPAASTVGINTRLGGDVSGDGQRLIKDARGMLIAVALKPYELVRVVMLEANLLDIESPA